MSHITEVFSLLKIPNIDAASILGSSEGHIIPFFSCFLLWALFLSFSFTHMTLLWCYLKLPLSVGGKNVCVWIFCCIPPPFPPSFIPYLLPPFHPPLPPFFPLLSLLWSWWWAWPFVVSSQGVTDCVCVCVLGRGLSLSSSWILRVCLRDFRDLGGGGDWRIIWCWFRWQRLRRLHLTAIFIPAAFFRLGIVSRQRPGLLCCWGVSVLLDMMCSIKVGAAQAPPSGREAAHT